MDQFIKIPLKLLKDEEYSDLSLEAICLHALLLDRLESSKRKGDQFKDENGAFYAVMSRDEIVDVLRVGKNKVPKIKKELIDHGLLEERSRGSRATLYYPQKLKTESGNVGLHALTKADELSTETGRHGVPKSDYSPPVMYQNRATWSTETGRHDVPKSDTNQTNYNQTNNNHTTSLTQDNLSNIFSDLLHYALNGLGKMHLGPIEMDIFRTDVREAISGDKDQEELIRLAIDEAARKKASSWQYVSTILKNWRVQGIKSVEDYDKVNRKRREEDLPEIPDWMGI